MELRTFLNDTGEGVVDFEPWCVSGPETEGELGQSWYAHLRVHGRRVFEYGSPCGTCGVLFKKLRSADDQLTDAEAQQLLGSLDVVPPDDVLRRLARILPVGTYRPIVVTARVQRVDPGSSDDYFANEVVRLFGFEPPDYKAPGGPSTSYWRVGENLVLPSPQQTVPPYRAMFTAVAMPFHDVARLDRERVEHWKSKARAGEPLTAVAVSMVDAQAPATWTHCPYEQMFLWSHCILDGHHRLQAAAELGVPVRILTLWSADFSLIDAEDALVVIEHLCAPAGS